MTEQSWDLIVVGAGNAGMPCAIAAAEAGARVLVLEKANEVGGTLHLTGGQMSAAGTRRQQRHGIDDSPDRHFDDVMRISHGRADPALVRLAVDLAASTVDWLEELGFPFVEKTPVIAWEHEPYSVPRTVWGEKFGVSILEALSAPWSRGVETGQIDLRLEHPMTSLLCQDGRVTGVRAGTAKGEETDYRGPSVVLTSGGYASNRELFAEVTPGNPPLVTAASPHSTGDGLQAARRLGARFRNTDLYLPSLGGLEPEPGSGVASDWKQLWANIVSPIRRAPREIYVNVRGERFIAEDEVSNDKRERAVRDQPQQKFWAIFDEAALTGEPLIMQWDEQETRRQAKNGKFVWTAETLEELGRKAGIDETGLLASARAYNEAVRQGDDPLGRRKLDFPLEQPPFYAILTHGCSFITFPGLAVDGELRVLDESGEPIPGLYAAGEILGNAALGGDAFCGGMAVTPALSFGRLLGRRLAAAG
jgi:fumarate reductase flavoprotein subunit